jgi:hypothetical protein
MNEGGYRQGDARVCRWDTGTVNAKEGEAYLPHSCDDWRIGDADHVRLLIADLKKLLTEMA